MIGAEDGEFDRLSTGELLALSRRILAELRRRNVIKSGNAPAGDYAELLTQQATKGELAPQSQKSWDVVTPDGDHLQVKARVVTDANNRGERQLSVFRSWEFDAAIVVLFADDFTVWKATRLPMEEVRAAATFIDHVHAWRVMATDELLARGDDWTERLRQAAPVAPGRLCTI